MTTATRPTEADGADDSPAMRAALAAHGLADRFVPATLGDGAHTVGPLDVFIELYGETIVWVVAGRIASDVLDDRHCPEVSRPRVHK